MGIEPTPVAWEATTLPLSYTRLSRSEYHNTCDEMIFCSPNTDKVSNNSNDLIQRCQRRRDPLFTCLLMLTWF